MIDLGSALFGDLPRLFDRGIGVLEVLGLVFLIAGSLPRRRVDRGKSPRFMRLHVPHLQDTLLVDLTVGCKRIPVVRLGHVADHPVGNRGKSAADTLLHLVIGKAGQIIAE